MPIHSSGDKELSSETSHQADSLPPRGHPQPQDSPLGQALSSEPGRKVTTVSPASVQDTVEAELWVPSGQGQVAFLSPRSPHCPPSLRSQPSPDRGPLRFQVDKVTRLKAGCIFSAPLPSSSAFPTQAGSLPLSTGTQATQPWPAEQPSQHSVMDGPVHPRPRQQNPWGHCSPHQAGPQLPGVGRETAGEACRDRGQGRPRLQLRPAVPRWFSGNNPSRRRLNTEPGQWVSSWLHSLCSVYQPLRAPEAEAGSRQ